LAGLPKSYRPGIFNFNMTATRNGNSIAPFYFTPQGLHHKRLW